MVEFILYVSLNFLDSFISSKTLIFCPMEISKLLVYLTVMLLIFFEASCGVTLMYKKLLLNPDFKPCDPIGCEIGEKDGSKPVCGSEGSCRSCMRDGECVMSYRVYLD